MIPTPTELRTVLPSSYCNPRQVPGAAPVVFVAWVGLIWASPFGPLRFDYAIPLTKGQFDRVQQFKFGGGTSF